MEKISLAVMRLQPMHNGHKLLIESMLKENTKVIIAIGSTQLSREANNPYTYEERKLMIEKVFPDKKIFILPLIDIGASKKEQWTEYVLKQVKSCFNITPTDYYTGSIQDGYWFEERLPIHIICREKEGEGINATEIRRRIREGESLFGIIPKEIAEITKGIHI